MKIYVGRWDLLPEEWEGINGLYEKSEEEIRKEVLREFTVANDKHFDDDIDPLIGTYSPIQFEETFNADNNSSFHGTTYWIKIF